MGLDVHTHMILGAQVKAEEIFQVRQEPPHRCPSCPKAYAKKQKFCDECGIKFSPLKTVTTWAPAVLSYLNGLGLGLAANDLAFGEDGEVPVFNVSVLQSSEDRRGSESWAIGVKFDGPSMDDHRSGSLAVGWAQLEEAKAEIEALLKGMGLVSREVKLFPVMYVSC